MGFELMIHPEENKAITALLWTTGADPRLVEVRRFVDEPDLGSWLKDVARQYGSQDLAVRWTDKFKGHGTLARLVAECLDTAAP